MEEKKDTSKMFSRAKTVMRQGAEGRGLYNIETGERVFKSLSEATIRQKRWLFFILEGKHKGEAVGLAGYGCKPRYYPIVADRLTLLFKKAIDEELRKIGWSPERVLAKWGYLADNAESEHVQLSASQTIGKHLGMIVDRRKIESVKGDDLSKKTTGELIEENRKLTEEIEQRNVVKVITEIEKTSELKEEIKKEMGKKDARVVGKTNDGTETIKSRGTTSKVAVNKS